VNIYIPIEVKVRELEGRTLLALAAAERGHQVILGSKKETLLSAVNGELPPGIVHMKSLTPSEQMLDQLTKMQSFGHLVTSQDEESGLLDESYEKFAKIRYSEESINLASGVFGWGEHDVECLQKIYPSQSKKILATGSPRVDFWRTDFENYFHKDSKLEQWKDKPYLLVVSNFGSVIRANKIWNVMARLREAGYFDRDPEMELFEYEYSGYMLQLIGHFVKMIRKVAETYPDVNILIRPHPVEAEDAWDKMVGSYPNVHVFRDGTISSWIRGATGIIHNGCTSALEAAVSGVPRIAYRPIPSPFEREIPNQLSREAFTMDELLEKVDHLLNQNSSRAEIQHDKEADQKLRERLVNVNGALAADRIVDYWEAIGSENQLKNTPLEKASTGNNTTNSRNVAQNPSLIRKIRSIASNVKQLLTEFGKDTANDIPIRDDGQLLDNSFKFNSYSDSEFEHILTNLQQTLDRFQDIEYKRISNRAILISGKKQSRKT
jgi:surface carbohydrate biosynthesis protein